MLAACHTSLISLGGGAKPARQARNASHRIINRKTNIKSVFCCCLVFAVAILRGGAARRTRFPTTVARRNPKTGWGNSLRSDARACTRSASMRQLIEERAAAHVDSSQQPASASTDRD